MKQRVVILVLLAALVSPVVLLAQEPLILDLDAPSTVACETLVAGVVGLSQKAAEGLAKNAGVAIRVMRRGERDQAATTDFRADRLNLNLNQGLVASAKCG
jgi:hypothetical protein